ncbi:uronyl 2-sulfotransferase-like [Ptychodera flava]|uniref:uronyl 2-sulfotransferase-like n=1 Tax=Ptychodera flava TaxID=63121 RepID=UPI003969FF9E
MGVEVYKRYFRTFVTPTRFLMTSTLMTCLIVIVFVTSPRRIPIGAVQSSGSYGPASVDTRAISTNSEAAPAEAAPAADEAAAPAEGEQPAADAAAAAPAEGGGDQAAAEQPAAAAPAAPAAAGGGDGDVAPDTGLPIEESRFHSHDRMVYNRVDKCGSRSLLYTIDELTQKHGYKKVTSEEWNKKNLTQEEQKELVDEINGLEPPFIYDRHVYYTPFQRFGSKNPVWINLIRDPLRRFISLYYFKRFGDPHTAAGEFNMPEEIINRSFDDCVLNNIFECSTKASFRVVPYFCGHGEGCRMPNKWAVEQAKKNVVENYALVGILEHFNTTLKLLDKLVPQYFGGAMDAYLSVQNTGIVEKFKSISGKPPGEEAMAKMKERLALEYDFYNFAVARMEHLAKQFNIET